MRASKAPEQWKLVLDAVNNDDYELANKLAVKYQFASEVHKEKAIDDIRDEPVPGDYVAMDPDGKMYCHVHASAVSTHLGLSFSYVGSAIARRGGRGATVTKGKMKGWKMWKEGSE